MVRARSSLAPREAMAISHATDPVGCQAEDSPRRNVEGSVLCLDDLERISATFPLQDALGYANHLAEHRDCRVLVIMNEEHLAPRFGAEQAGLIGAYRERVVRSYLKLETTLSEALPHLRMP